MADLVVITLGCRLNAYETEVMRAHAGEAGLDDAVMVNTCAVTGEAVRQARQTIRRRGANNPTRGSSSPAARRRSSRQRFAAMPEVDLVLGNAEKMRRGDIRGFASATARASRSTTS